MPMNSNIALSGQLPKLDNPLELYGQVQQIQGMQQRNRLADLMFAEKERESQQENALNALYRDAVGADGAVDRTKVLTGAAQGGLGSKIPALQKGFADVDKTQAAAAAERIKAARDQIELVAQVTGGIKDQSTYDVGAAFLRSRNIPFDTLGPTYDPAKVQQIQQMALSTKDRLDQQWKALDYRLNIDKFGETKRSNQVTEGIAGANLGLRRQEVGLKQQELAAGGKPPPGYRWNGDGTLAPIPGGPGDKLPEAQQKQVIGTQNLSAAIQEYRDALKNFGMGAGLSPDKRALMGTKYNNMMLQAKEAYNLGVLNGPDLDILQSVVTDPRSFKGAITSNSALDKQAAELDRIMRGVGSTASQQRPRSGNAAPVAGGLTAAEQQELADLRQRLGKR